MHIVVAMSGGVDSSVTALLLKEAGHRVTGVFLRNGVSAPSSGSHKGCCSARDACDAEEVAGILGIPFYSLDHSRPFARIVEDFIADYAAGLTPNPCVQCNRDVKFGELLQFAQALGARRVASGHYARCSSRGGEVHLRRGRDRAKDQSYVLATVPREALVQSLFPCGELHKDEVRGHAERAGLPVHAKAESQEICFVPSGDYRDLLRARRPDLFAPGPVVDGDGKTIGAHDGHAGFTVGQRRGLKLGGKGPWFVVETDPQANAVRVGRREDVGTDVCRIEGCSWLVDPLPGAGAYQPAPRDGLRLQVRAHHAAVPVRRLWADGPGLMVELARKEVVSPGQIAVLYRGDRVLAAGRFVRPRGTAETTL